MKDDLLARYLSNFLIVQIIFVQIISRFPNTIEKYYSNGIYKVISLFYRTSLGWIPFSVGDLLYGIFFLLFIRFIYILFRDKLSDLRSYRLSVGATLSVLYFFFYLGWGMNYYRVPLATKLDIEKEEYSTKLLNNFTLKTVEVINELHQTVVEDDSLAYVVPYSRREIYKMAKSGYTELGKKHKYFRYKVSSVKHSLLSTVLTYMGFAGYINPFSGEAQINSKIPMYTLAFTTSHEIAHQIGYAAENEANFIGYLASTSHEDAYFKLAGHITALKYLLNELNKRDEGLYKTAVKSLNYGVVLNLRESNEFWSQYENPFEPLFKKTYNIYLKANRQKSGIKSYSYMVDLLLHYSNQKT
ncbi:DUF3810 domain-containing protein [Flavicella sp.]|uniref:DUF3810 domain-containing protein n=1 Tax=Flavicella sp. TaxID=2957742 RepID=UPI003017B4BF